jgi:GH25 family lysozyme M1 (1,4-beta-N-acetylmuramidase)
MKHQWHPRRALVVTPDGQQRWDRAYQSLLAWGQPPALPLQSPEDQDARESQEVPHARSSIRACLDAEPGAHADH